MKKAQKMQKAKSKTQRCLSLTPEAQAVLARCENASAFVSALAADWPNLVKLPRADMQQRVLLLNQLLGPRK